MSERDEIELVGNPAREGSLAADMQREFEVARGRLTPPEWMTSPVRMTGPAVDEDDERG